MSTPGQQRVAHIKADRPGARVLVIGGNGAVGRTIVTELTRLGHHATSASRQSNSTPLDLGASDAADMIAQLAQQHDVVINASGREDPRLVAAVQGKPYVDISATARFIDEARQNVSPGQSVLLGAGLVPGLSTLLIASLATKPGDEVDLGIVLGTGERHGPAAVEWTAALAGELLHAPPEGGAIPNFSERRRLPSATGPRKYLRTDFPDHLLIGAANQVTVRSYLAVGDAGTTAALRLVGMAPRLAPLLAKFPHLGNDLWSLTAVNRRTSTQLAVQGNGQSRATGILTAIAAVRLLEQLPGRIVTAADLLELQEIPDLRDPGASLLSRRDHGHAHEAQTL